MKFGMPTLVECKDITECAAVAGRFGLDFVEVNMSFPQYLPSRSSALQYRELSQKHGIFYTVHADEQLNPFDFNPAVSDCYFKVMGECIDFSLEIGVPIINMHLLKGVYVTLPEKVVLLTDVYKDEYLERVRSFIKMCEERIAGRNLKISIENVDTNLFTSSQVDALEYFMKSEVFGLTLDVGHDDCMAGKDAHVFKKYLDKLCHLHLHDSDGKHAHLALGDGRVDIREKLSMLTPGSTCLVEVKTVDGLEKSIEYLRSNNLLR